MCRYERPQDKFKASDVLANDISPGCKVCRNVAVYQPPPQYRKGDQKSYGKERAKYMMRNILEFQDQIRPAISDMKEKVWLEEIIEELERRSRGTAGLSKGEFCVSDCEL